MADHRRGVNGLAISFDTKLLSRLQNEDVAGALDKLEKRLNAAYLNTLDDGVEPVEALSWMLLWVSEEMLKVRERRRKYK